MIEQVIHLMSIYNGLSGKDDNLEQCYTLLNLAGQVAIRVSVSRRQTNHDSHLSFHRLGSVSYSVSVKLSSVFTSSRYGPFIMGI